MRKTKEKAVSLKTHLWMYFCGFAVAVMLILLLLQIFFLSAFYNTMKLNELKKVGKLISEQYNPDSENFYEFWLEHSFNSGIFAQLVTEDGAILNNFNNAPGNNSSGGNYGNRPSARPHVPPFGRNRQSGGSPYGNYEDFFEKIKGSSRNEVAYIVEADGKRGAFGVYGTCIGEFGGQKIYLRLMSPLERTDTTRKVLQTQLLIASIFSILMALAIAYFIAKRFLKPIEKITKGAAILAKGNYDVRFEKSTYKEINELSDTLNYATSELSKTDELRRDLISNVSHDLRTPLTIIKSYAELIRDISGANEEKRNKHTEVIIEEANNLSRLVNDILDLSGIQSDTVRMEIKEFDFVSLVASTLRRFDYYCENYGIEFRTEFDLDSAVVLGDERRIEQVIYNLVANAVNYVGDDKQIVVSMCHMGENVRLTVEDHGCGIPENELDFVWDRYYKTSASHKREKIGTGIGLSIVKNVLLAHETAFGVESMEGSGSKFWFELKKIPADTNN